MQKSLISKVFILLLVVGLLFAVAPTKQAQAATVVTTEQQLLDALSGTGDIELGASFTLTATVDVNRSVTIDGKGYVITGPPVAPQPKGHGFTIYANGVTIKNLTITGSGRSNLNFYVVTGGVVDNVILSNAGSAGMIVNGSQVTITNVTTSGNAWGGINVDQGGGVTAIPLLTVTNVTTHTSPAGRITAAIWVDKGNAAWVSASDMYTPFVGTPLVFYDKAEFAAATVFNVRTGIMYSTIQAAIDATTTVAGDVIYVPAGTYVENVLVDKQVSIIGAGSGTDGTIVTTPAGFDTKVGVFQITGSGTSGAPLLLQNMRVEPVGQSGVSVGRFTESTGLNVSYLTLDNIYVSGSYYAPATEQERGFYVDLTSTVDYLTVTDSVFTRLTYGWYLQKAVSADTSTVSNVSVSNTTFSFNAHKGFYAEKLTDAVFTDCTFDNNGSDDTVLPVYFNDWKAGVDINLKAGIYSDISFIECNITNNGTGNAKEGVGIAIKARTDGASYGPFPATLTDVLIQGGTITGNERGIRLGEPGKSNAGPTNVVIKGVELYGNVKTYSGSEGSAYGDVVNQSLAPVAATPNWWNHTTGPAAGQIYGDASYVPWCLDATCTTFGYPPVHNTTQNTYFTTIQAAINAAGSGNTIEVAAGTYLENVTVNKTLTLTGAGRDLVTIQGSNLAQDGVFNVTADDVTVEGFTIKGAGYKTVRVSGVNNRLTFKNNKVIAAANTTKANGWSAFETDYNQLCTGHVVTGNIFVGNGTAQLVYYNHNTGITFTGNTFEGTTVDNMYYGPVLGFDGLDGTQTISGNTFNVKRSGGDFRYSVYALIETFGTYDLEAIRAANIFQYDGVAQDTVVFKNKIRPAYQYNSTNDLNKAKQTPGHIGEDAAYVELVSVSIPDGTITLRFVNPRTDNSGFEVRVDGEATTRPNDTHWNPWLPDYIYRSVYPGNGAYDTTRTYSVEEYLEVRRTFGSERDFDFDWTRFEFLGEIYVDDSFTGSEEGFGVRKFSSLQAAIDAALPYATIRVAAGTYSDGGSDGFNINEQHLTLILEDGVIIQNTSPCFTIEQSYTSIISEENLGAVCVPTNSSNAIEVLAGLKNIIIKGIYFDTDQGGGAFGVINFQGAIEDVQILDNYFHVDMNLGVFVYDGVIFRVAPTGIVEIKGNLFDMNNLSGCAVNNFFGNPATPIDASFNSFATIDGHPVTVPEVRICENVTYAPFTNVDLYLESSGTPWLNQEINGQKFTLTVKGDLQNVAGAIFTLHYDPAQVDLDETTLTNLSGFSGAAGENIFTVDETLGTITFAGEKYPAASGAGLGLFSAEFTALQTGPAPFTLSSGREHFTMIPGYGTSSNIYYYELLPVTVDVIALPTISSTDIQGYYLENEPREFTVVLDNPSTGADYEHVYVDFNIADARVAQIEKIEYSVEGSPWIEIGTAGSGTSISDGPTNNVIGYFGKITGGGFSLAAGQQKETLFRVTFKTREQGVDDYPTSYAVTMQLMDADALPSALMLDDFSDTMYVYDKPTITSTDIQGYYLTGEEREFHVTGANPLTGKNYSNVMYKITLPNTVTDDITNIQYYETYPTTGYVPLALTQDGANVVAWFGLANYGGFPMAPGFSDSPSFLVTFATAKDYSVLIEQYDVALDPDRLLVAETFTATVYAKPVITPTNLGGPFDAGVPETVSLSIANTSIPEPFEVVFVYPAGTVISYGGIDYTCTTTCPPISVDLTAEPTDLDFTVTFDEAWTGTVGVSLFDSDWTPADRLLASATAIDVVVSGDFSFIGTVSMQGNLNRAGVPVIFDLVSEFDPAYVRTFTTVNTISGNLTGTLTYGGDYLITTNQPRYLNVIAANNRLLSLPLAVGKTMNPLELKAGNAIYTDNIINNLDSGHVGSGYIGGIATYPDADVNFDNKINIQDLALVGGNYMLDHTVYDSWVVVTP